MIRIERVELPPGLKAFARRENGTMFVYVSAGLSAAARLAAIREALRASPDIWWHSGRHPVLLPALAGGAGLRRAPGGRWAYWALLTLAVAVAAGVVAVIMLSGAGTARNAAAPSATLQPGASPAPSPDGQPSSAPSQAGVGGAGGTRSSPAAPDRNGPASPAKRRSRPGAPAPQASGEAVPVTTSTSTSPSALRPRPASQSSPQPGSQSSSPPPAAPKPRPSPSPSPQPSQGSPGICVDLLGVTVCVG